jgi:uracil phosphoribosyltransferase
MNKVVILNHPLIDHKMAKIRDKRTGTKEFRESVSEVGGLLLMKLQETLKQSQNNRNTNV